MHTLAIAAASAAHKTLLERQTGFHLTPDQATWLIVAVIVLVIAAITRGLWHSATR